MWLCMCICLYLSVFVSVSVSVSVSLLSLCCSQPTLFSLASSPPSISGNFFLALLLKALLAVFRADRERERETRQANSLAMKRFGQG